MSFYQIVLLKIDVCHGKFYDFSVMGLCTVLATSSDARISM